MVHQLSLLSLNPLFLTDPSKELRQLERKQLIADTLSKICFVSFIALTAVGLAVSFGLITMPILPLAGVILGSGVFNQGMSFYQQKALSLKPEIQKTHFIALKLSVIEGWKTQEIENFLANPDKDDNPDNTIEIDDTTRSYLEGQINSLMSKDPLPIRWLKREHPLTILLPVIARRMAYKELSQNAFLQSRAFYHVDALPPEAEASQEDPLSSTINAWHRIEIIALPALLTAALMNQLLVHPEVELDSSSDPKSATPIIKELSDVGSPFLHRSSQDRWALRLHFGDDSKSAEPVFMLKNTTIITLGDLLETREGRLYDQLAAVGKVHKLMFPA